MRLKGAEVTTVVPVPAPIELGLGVLELVVAVTPLLLGPAVLLLSAAPVGATVVEDGALPPISTDDDQGGGAVLWCGVVALWLGHVDRASTSASSAVFLTVRAGQVSAFIVHPCQPIPPRRVRGEEEQDEGDVKHEILSCVSHGRISFQGAFRRARWRPGCVTERLDPTTSRSGCQLCGCLLFCRSATMLSQRVEVAQYVTLWLHTCMRSSSPMQKIGGRWLSSRSVQKHAMHPSSSLTEVRTMPYCPFSLPIGATSKSQIENVPMQPSRACSSSSRTWAKPTAKTRILLIHSPP